MPAPLPEITDTYTITDPEDVVFCGRFLGTVTDAISGRVTAVFESGRVVIGEPLWSCCDQPVADGDCGCIRPVTLSPIMPETEEFYRNASLEEWMERMASKYPEAAE